MSDYYFTLSAHPTIWFAHRYQTDHYDYSFPSQRNALEVTYILEGAVHWQRQGHAAAVLEPETILISPREIPFSVSCPQGRHIPVSYTHLDVYKRQAMGNRQLQQNYCSI